MKDALFWCACLVTIGLFGFTQYQIFYGTPVDSALFFSQKIFYYHVPCAFVLFVSVIVCGIYSLLYLKHREGRYDDIAQAAGGLSVLFGAMVLVTGSIWGKAAWGVWWQWDMRLTTSLLLWMVMVGYVLVRTYGGASSQRLAAGLAVFGMADVPLIYGSVKIWNTLHPPSSVVPDLTSTMRATFWLSVLLFFSLYIILLKTRVAGARAQRSIYEAREQALDAGLF